MSKSADAFRTIREVADWLGVPTHVLRFWESKFDAVSPVKGPGGRRYYRPDDMRLLGGIRVLLHDQGMTIRGVQKMISEDGARPIEALSPEPAFAEPQAKQSTSRTARRGANRRVVKEDANAGGTGQGGLYDLDALSEDTPAQPAEAPMVHVEPEPVEAEVLSFANALKQTAADPEDAAPPAEPVDETLILNSAQQVAEAPSAPLAPELPLAPPLQPAAKINAHAIARALTQKAASKRGANMALTAQDRANLGRVTRKIRLLTDRISTELKS